MTLEEILKSQGYTDEQIAKIVAGMTENKIYTTKEENIDERYSKLKEQKAELDTQIADRDKQLEDLSKKAKGNEELETQIKELQELNRDTLEEYENKLKEQDFNYKLDVALRTSKVKNVKAVQALLDKSTIKLDGDNLTGLEDQIKALKESDSYLFEETTPVTTGGSGNFGNKGQPKVTGDLDLSKMNYKEILELKTSNQEAYETLIKE